MTISVTSKRDSAILDYLAGGYALFPCGQPDDIKAPAYKGWQSTPYDPLLEPSSLPDMFGVALTEEDLVLDVDPRRFKPDVNQLTALWKQLGLGKIETYMVRTGGGGIHIYYKKPADVLVTPRVPGYPAIEVKTKGTFVVGAGSRHPNYQHYVTGPVECKCGGNASYEVERLMARSVSACPDSLLDLVRSSSGAGVLAGSSIVQLQLDDEGARRRFIQYCLHANPAIEGEGGDKKTFKVACEGRDYGLGEELVYEIMRDYFNSRCNPPWDDHDLRAKVANAFVYATGEAGRLHPANDFPEAWALRQQRLLDVSAVPPHVVVEGDRIAAEEQAHVQWDVHSKGPEAGQLKPTLSNAKNFFDLAPHGSFTNPVYRMLRYNQFSDNIEFVKPAPWHDKDYPQQFWEDHDAIELKLWFSNQKNFNVGTSICHEVAVAASRAEQYHPVRNWLQSLCWDGVPRLDYLYVEYAGAPNTEYVREVGKNTLIAAVARVMRPGCQHDHMPVLEGRQGTGKSSFVRTLGGEWYADIIIDPHHKDTVAGMQGSWFLEASEMEFTKKAEVNALKAFLTRTHDRVRLAYARSPVTLPRQCVFIGTVNPGPTGYLTDSTGNRRFWPIVTTRINIPRLRADREQLFAEAYHRWKSGEQHFISSDGIVAQAQREQAMRLAADPWEEILIEWFATEAENLGCALTTATIAACALNLMPAKLNIHEKNRLVRAITAAGYYSSKVWDKEKKMQVRAWVKDSLAGL